MKIYFYDIRAAAAPLSSLKVFYFVLQLIKGAEIIRPGQVITWTQFRIGLEKKRTARERKGKKRERRDM